MKVLAVGGGSGGHVTPVAAVLRELALEVDSGDSLDVVFVCDRAFERQARGLMNNLPFPVVVKRIPSGKLRRYAHFSWWQYMRHFSIVLANLIDMFKVIGGFFVSIWIIGRLRPDVVFAKGGYVCLPVGLAARVFRVPLVIHDSDALPGLTNRVLARFASAIGTGMPLENYDYNKAISRYVGVPVNAEIVPVTTELQRRYRQELGLPLSTPLVVAVGGGLGSIAINTAVIATARASQSEDMLFYNITGVANKETAEQQSVGITNYKAEPFVYQDMYKVLGAADIVVTRASATTLQELAGLRKTVVAVPARQLGDQQKNAQLFARYDAAIVLQDAELSEKLTDTVHGLMDAPERRKQLAENLHSFARPQAAGDMARLIIAATDTKNTATGAV